MPRVCHTRAMGGDEHHWKLDKFYFLHLPSNGQGLHSLDQPWRGRAVSDRYLAERFVKKTSERFSEFAAVLLKSAFVSAPPQELYETTF